MCDSERLSQLYPVVEATGCITLKSHGWSLSLRHRHFSGSWSDCSLEVFERLTIGELQDVLDAHVAAWPQPSPHQSA